MKACQQIIEPQLDAFRSVGALAPELAAAADASAQTHSLRCSAERADRSQHARSAAPNREICVPSPLIPAHLAAVWNRRYGAVSWVV
jgi:hypothetical protein